VRNACHVDGELDSKDGQNPPSGSKVMAVSVRGIAP